MQTNWVEKLEERRLLSAVGLHGKAVTIRGDDAAANVVHVKLSDDGAQLSVTLNGQESLFKAAKVRKLTFHGGEGNDVVTVDPAVTIVTRLFGRGGDDVLAGGSGNDVIRGGAGHDFITGGPGNDRLYAGAGIDWMEGGEGNDLLVARRGQAMLSGDAGSDVFVVNPQVTILDLSSEDTVIDALSG